MRSLFSQNRRGQVGNLVPAILALVFAAVVLVFGLIISQSLRDVDTLKNSASTINETGAYLNATGYTLTGEKSDKTDTFALTAIWKTDVNGSYVTPVALAYAASVPDTGIVTAANATVFDTNISYSYTYQTGGESWEAANNTIIGLGTFADFWEIIVLAIVITVVIGLLLAVFGGRKQER